MIEIVAPLQKLCPLLFYDRGIIGLQEEIFVVRAVVGGLRCRNRTVFVDDRGALL